MEIHKEDALFFLLLDVFRVFVKFSPAHSIQTPKKQLKNVLLWSFTAALSCDFLLTFVAHARICAPFGYNRAFFPGFASIVNTLTRF